MSALLLLGILIIPIHDIPDHAMETTACYESWDKFREAIYRYREARNVYSRMRHRNFPRGAPRKRIIDEFVESKKEFYVAKEDFKLKCQ